MIGLDSNVILRYLVRDDEDEAKRVDRLFATAGREEKSLYLNLIVLCEIVWVLESGYGFSRKDVAETLERIFRTSQFVIERPSIAWQALSLFKNSKADYADCLIVRVNQGEGYERTYTFDRDARGAGMELVSS